MVLLNNSIRHRFGIYGIIASDCYVACGIGLVVHGLFSLRWRTSFKPRRQYRIKHQEFKSLINQDKTCICRDCGQEFIFTAQEQQVFESRGFRPPTRCIECHDKRSSRRNYNRSGDSRSFTVTCSVCGNEATVPFKPTENKPVLCKDCFAAQRDAQSPQSTKAFVLKKPEKAIHDVAVSADAESGNIGSFSDFNFAPPLERAIAAAGYENPTPVQAATIPIALAGRDLIGTAQTGTGKTAAFVLPILQHLLANPSKGRCTRAIVLTPTRELAEQINDAFKELGRFTKIRSASVYGGVGMNPQERALRGGADVIVACPGRLIDHVQRGNTNFSHVDMVVLDEADRMLDMGFLPPIKQILTFLPAKRQTMMFSATFAPELTKLTEETLRDPQRVDVDICAPPKTIAHALYPCPQHLKTPLVLQLLDQTDTNSVLIFTRTKHRADKLAQQIARAGYATTALHANKSQNQRQTALDDFRRGRCQILVATDIAARGLDIQTISHVVNYDIPDTADAYIHRIGRTGRAERDGDAITLVTRQDTGIVWDIEKALGSKIERIYLDDFDYKAPPAAVDEFKRGPAPRMKTSPDVLHSRTASSASADGSLKEKSAPKKNASFFATKRKQRAR